MRTLTDYQKNFILEYFFKNEEYAGWKKIATKLLEDGKCIVAGNTCIWIGDIGNFIKTSEADDCFGCLKYEFDLDEFLTSILYDEKRKYYISILFNQQYELQTKIIKISNEMDDIKKLTNNR